MHTQAQGLRRSVPRDNREPRPSLLSPNSRGVGWGDPDVGQSDVVVVVVVVVFTWACPPSPINVAAGLTNWWLRLITEPAATCATARSPRPCAVCRVCRVRHHPVARGSAPWGLASAALLARARRRRRWSTSRGRWTRSWSGPGSSGGRSPRRIPRCIIQRYPKDSVSGGKNFLFLGGGRGREGVSLEVSSSLVFLFFFFLVIYVGYVFILNLSRDD